MKNTLTCLVQLRRGNKWMVLSIRQINHFNRLQYEAIIDCVFYIKLRLHVIVLRIAYHVQRIRHIMMQ